MAEHQVRSFAEVSFLEAVARHSRVDLETRPIRPGADGRLASRFLGLQGDDYLVLDIPKAAGRKVLIPIGWQIGLAFAVGPYLLQARTTVIDLVQHPLRSRRRVDALLVQRPAKIIAADRRQHPRHELDRGACIFVSLWPAQGLAEAPAAVAQTGRVLDYSETGLGIRLEAPPACPVGAEVIVRLEQGSADRFPIFRAVLKHQTESHGGFWVAGLGEVREMAPGEAPAVLQAIVADEALADDML